MMKVRGGRCWDEEDTGGNGSRDETDDAPVAGERRRKRSAERVAKANWHWQRNDERHLLGLSLHLVLCQVLIMNTFFSLVQS